MMLRRGLHRPIVMHRPTRNPSPAFGLTWPRGE